jgi:5-formyltetrahydrofolate cyclo-ligase
MSVEAIRKQIREARRAIPKSYRAGASAKICESFLQLPAFQVAKAVAGFLAFDGEADPLGLMIAACNMGKQVFVPVIVETKRPLMFAPWTPDTKFKTNRFGISEPDAPSSEWVLPEQLDFVINPLVAFDRQLNRIGVGGGYYDRTFQFLRESPTPRPTQLFGFAFEMQRIDQITPHDWDVPLDSVITELESYGR